MIIYRGRALLARIARKSRPRTNRRGSAEDKQKEDNQNTDQQKENQQTEVESCDTAYRFSSEFRPDELGSFRHLPASEEMALVEPPPPQQIKQRHRGHGQSNSDQDIHERPQHHPDDLYDLQ
jgi:hypothetical protein